MKTSTKQKVKNRGRAIASYHQILFKAFKRQANIVSLGKLAVRVIHSQLDLPHPLVVLALIALNIALSLLLVLAAVAIYATILYN